MLHTQVNFIVHIYFETKQVGNRFHVTFIDHNSKPIAGDIRANTGLTVTVFNRIIVAAP
jgi:hypothetical protein